jgi:two-component system LytT family response regulator
MRTVIIDDEKKSRQTLLNFIAKYASQLTVIGEADCVEKGVELIDSEKPDLVFLDIQMPDGTGFDLLGQVEYSGFKLIFCTSYDNYAVKAFRFSAIDYLLKPVDPDIFTAAIKKALTESNGSTKKRIDTLQANKTDFNRLALHAAEGISIVRISDIIRCESSINYTHFIMVDGTKILVTKTLKDYDELLCNHGFIRIHKSHLVNLNHIKKYIKGEGGWVIMADDSKIEVSRRKKDSLLEILGNL